MSTSMTSAPTPITPSGEMKPLLMLTDKAIDKVKYFAQSMPDSQGKPLRVFVQGGGCSGFQYGFTFDEKKDGDAVMEQGGVTVLVDPQSAGYCRAIMTWPAMAEWVSDAKSEPAELEELDMEF